MIVYRIMLNLSIIYCYTILIKNREPFSLAYNIVHLFVCTFVRVRACLSMYARGTVSV